MVKDGNGNPFKAMVQRGEASMTSMSEQNGVLKCMKCSKKLWLSIITYKEFFLPDGY